MGGALRRMNRHAQEVLLSEALDHASRTFHIAHQLALAEESAALDRLVNSAKFETDGGRRLARAALANYAAAAIVLPYGPFRAAARELRHDIEAMARRFGASFEQIAHRLTTLQRPGAEESPSSSSAWTPPATFRSAFPATSFRSPAMAARARYGTCMTPSAVRGGS